MVFGSHLALLSQQPLLMGSIPHSSPGKPLASWLKPLFELWSLCSAHEAFVQQLRLVNKVNMSVPPRLPPNA